MARQAFILAFSMLALVAGNQLLAGCGGDAGSASSANELGSGAEDCVATFTWWQKDAYLSSPGHNDPLWPPHTTTELQVACGGQVVSTASMTNHGTALGSTSDAGVPMLTNMGSATVNGSQADLMNLVSAYQSCACDPASPGAPGTQFLSAQPPSPVMGQVLTAVEAYVQQNLQCPGGTTSNQIASMLKGGDFGGAEAVMVGCTWANGTSFEAGLSQAASTVSGELASVVAGYHVCNNDAMLQADLFLGFQSTGSIAACDPTSDVCQGPRFFYDPPVGGATSGGSGGDGGTGAGEGGPSASSEGGGGQWEGGYASPEGGYGYAEGGSGWSEGGYGYGEGGGG